MALKDKASSAGAPNFPLLVARGLRMLSPAAITRPAEECGILNKMSPSRASSYCVAEGFLCNCRLPNRTILLAADVSVRAFDRIAPIPRLWGDRAGAILKAGTAYLRQLRTRELPVRGWSRHCGAHRVLLSLLKTFQDNGQLHLALKRTVLVSVLPGNIR